MVRRVAFILTLLLACQQAPGAPDPNAKAAKVHRLLVKRPSPGYLFGRFTDAWLVTGSYEDLESFLQARATDPGTSADKLLLAYFYSNQRETAKALELFRLALSQDPGNAEAWLEKAKLESRNFEFSEALSDLAKASNAKPKEELRIEIAKLQGQLHLRLDKPHEALKAWRQLLEDHPEDDDLWEDLIDVQANEGLHKEAIKTASELIARTRAPYQQVIRRLHLGNLYQQTEQRKLALETFSQTLDKTGADSWLEKEILAQIERAFRRTEDISGLTSYLQELKASHPRRLALHLRHANLLAETGAQEEAKAAFEEIMRRTPGERRYREAYIDLLAKLKDFNQAIEQANVLIDSNPEDTELRVRLAALQHASGNLPEAKNALDSYLEQSGKSEYAYLRVARLLERYQMPEAAEATYESLTQAHPDSQAALEAQAAFLHAHDQPSRAIEIWTSMANGADRPELARIARLLSSRHETQAAFDLLQTRLEEFSRDPLYLNELCQLAIRLERYAEGIPWGRERLSQASNAFELETAIKQMVRLARGAQQLPTILTELQAKHNRSLNENCLLAELLEQEGDSKTASTVLSSSVGKTPSEQIILLDQQIRLLELRHEWLLAAEVSEKLINLPGGRKPIHLQKTLELYEKAGAWEKALFWVAEWKQLAPGNIQPWLTEARLLDRSNQRDQAIAVLRRGLQQIDDNETIRTELAALYTDQGQTVEAMRLYWRLYEDATEISDKLSWVKTLARTADRGEQLDALIQAFEERHQSNRTSTLPLLALSEIYAHTGNLKKQRETLSKASSQRPEDLNILLQLATIEERQGEPGDALRTLEAAAALDKTDRTQRRIVQLHLDQGDVDPGFKLLEELAGGKAMGPREAEALAETMLNSSHYTKAISFLGPHVARHPQDYRLGYLYGIALEEEQHSEEATTVFLELLGIDQELPHPTGTTLTTSSTQPSYQQRRWQSLRDEAPSGVVDLLEQTSFDPRRAYAHQHTRRHRQLSSFRVPMALPQRLEEVPHYVIPHLATLTLDQEDLLNTTQVALRTQGYAYPHITLAKALPQGWIDLETLLDEPEIDSNIAGYWVIQDMSTMSSGELAMRIFNHFETSHPQLAIRVALQACNTGDESAQSIIDRGFQLVDQIVKPSPTFVRFLSQFYHQQEQSQIASSLPTTQLDQLAKKLVAWYADLSDQDKPQCFNSIALGLRLRPDLGLFFKHLDLEIERLARTSAPAQPNVKTRTRQHKPVVIQALTFPPEPIDYPAHIVSIVLARPEVLWTRNYYQDLAPFQSEALSGHVDSLRDPVLKCLVTFQIGDNEATERAIESLLAKNRSAEHLLLAAAYAGDQGETAKAVELLIEAGKLPIGRSTKARFHAAIIAYAMDAPNDVTLRNHGREAAMRLRRQAKGLLSPDALIAAMTDLGLEAEADVLAKTSPHQANSTRSAWSSGPIGRRTTQQPKHEQIEKLVEEGRENAAIKASVQELTALANRHLTTHNFRSGFYQSHQIVDALRLNNLVDKFLEAADPGQQASGRRLSQFAIINLMLGEDDRAHSLLEASLQRRPKDEATRMHYFLSLVERDPKEAIAQLQHLRPHLLGPLGNGIQQVLTNTPKLQDRAPILDAVLDAVKQTKYHPSSDLHWLIQIIDLLGVDHYEDEFSIPSLYIRYPSTNMPSTDADRAKRRKLIDLHRSLHDDHCRALLDVPSVSALAFARLTARPLYDGVDGAEFLEEAKRAYVNSQPSRVVFPSNHWNDLDFIPFHAPDKLLLRQAAQSSTLTELTQEIVPLLESKGRKREARLWEHQIELLTCQPADFLVAAERFLKRSRFQTLANRNDPHMSMRRLIDLWKFRQLDTFLTPLVLDHLNATKTSRNHGRDYLVSYAAHLQTSGRHEETSALFAGIADSLLGPSETRAMDLAKHYNPNQWSNHTRSADFHIYKEVMTELGKHEALTCLATDATELFWRHSNNRDSLPLEHFLSPRILSHAHVVKALVHFSPWLRDTSQLHLYPRANQPSGTYFQSVFKALERNSANAESKAAVLELINSLDAPTLGTRLVSAFLNDKEDDVPGILMSAREAILSLPKQNQADWGYFVREMYDDVADIPTEDAKLAEFLSHLHTVQVSDLTTDIASYIASATSPRRNRCNSVIEARDLIIRLFEHAPHDMTQIAKAHEIANAANTLSRRGQQQSRYRSRLQVNQAEIQLISELVNRGDLASQSRAYIGFALERYARNPDPQFGPVTISDHFLSELSTGLSKQLAAATESGRFPTIPAAHALLTDWFGQRDLSLVSDGVASSTALPKLKNLEEALHWLEQQPAEDTVAHTMEMAVRRLRAQRKDEAIQAPDPAVTAANVSLMEDTSRPLPWRIALAYRRISEHPATALRHDSFRMACGQVLLAAWKDRRVAQSVASDQATTILKSLSTPHKATQGWKALGQSLVEAWRQLKPPSQNPGQDEVQHILSLALACDATHLAQRLVKQYPIHLLNTMTPLASLIESKHLSLASALASQFSNHPLPFRQGNSRNYNRDLEANLPDFLAKVDDLDTRFFLEVLLKSQADNTEEGDAPAMDRTTRLQKLLPRLAGHAFTQQRYLRRCLTLTQQAPLRFSPELTPMIDRAVKDLDIASVIQIRDSSLKRQWIDLIGMRISHHAALGSPEPFINAVTQVTTLQLKDPYEKVQTHDRLGAAFIQGATYASMHAEDRSVREALLPAYRSLAFDRDSYHTAWILQVLVAHAEFDELAAFDAAFQARFEDRVGSQKTTSSRVASVLEKVLPDEDRLPEAERMRIALAVYEHPIFKNPDIVPVKGITLDDVFSAKDLLVHHELILSKTSNPSETLAYLRQLADQLETTETELPEVIKSLNERAKATSTP